MTDEHFISILSTNVIDILKVIHPQYVLFKCNIKKQTYTIHIQDFQVTSFSFVNKS